MEFKPEPHQSISKDQLVRNIVSLTKSSLLPEITQVPKKKKQLFPNGYANQKFFDRYVRSEYTLAGSVCVNLLLIIIYFEMNIQENKLKNWLLYMSLALQFFCIFTLLINYKVFNEYKGQQNRHYELKRPRQLLLYSLILLVKPYPFLEDFTLSFENELFLQVHKVNDILCILSLFEVFLIIPSLFISSKFQSIRSQRISQMYGIKSNYIYALRCWFKENSSVAVAVSFMLWFLVCVLAIRIAEYQSNQILKSFENSVWFTFITMSTVGLGDLKPLTNIGYIVNTVTMYSGVIISSIAVMLLRNIFSLSPRQKRTLIILKSLQEKQQLRVVACEYIRESLWRLWRNKKNKQFGIKDNPSLIERNLREQFKKIRRSTQKMNYQNTIKDEFKHNFAKVYGYIDNLKDNHESIIQFLHTKRY